MSVGWRRQRERGHRLLLATIIRIALGLGRRAGLEVLAARLGEGQGCLLLGSHLGCFEVARACGREYGIEVRLVMHEDNAPMIREAFARLNPEAVTDVIPSGTAEAMLRVQECLARGGVVGILGDRVVNPAHIVECPFLGRPTAFPSGTFRLASLLEVPVVLFFGLYLGGNRYAIHFELLAERIDRARPDRARPDRAGAARYWTERYAERLEHYCRMAPYNWFNFYDYWGDEDAVTTRRRRARSGPGRAPAEMRRVRGRRGAAASTGMSVARQSLGQVLSTAPRAAWRRA